MPDAKAVSVNVGGKNYDMTKGADGIWEVTTDALVPGFHYYTMNVDGKRIADPNSRQYFGSFYWSSGIEVPEVGVDYYLGFLVSRSVFGSYVGYPTIRFHHRIHFRGDTTTCRVGLKSALLHSVTHKSLCESWYRYLWQIVVINNIP